MSKVTDEAGKFIMKVLMDRSVPLNIKAGIRNELTAPSARETELRNAIATADNSSNSASVRIAAMRIVIQFFKGDR